MIWAWISFVGAFLDLSIKQGIERLPKEDYPAPLSGSGGMIRIHQFHNLGLPFGHMQGRNRFVKYLPLMMGSLILGKLSLLLPQKGKKLEKIAFFKIAF